ncbi:MAG: hypothetical protein LBB21_02595 [Holosporaceae bacterium]|jgi:hypothetical protein|nr:hypothetical protein [Holosporaceae bacterium]
MIRDRKRFCVKKELLGDKKDSKTVKSSSGELELSVPRDRNKEVSNSE